MPTRDEMIAFGTRLRGLADAYDQSQKLRIAVGNRIGAAARGDDESEPDQFVASIEDDLMMVESKLRREMARELIHHPAWPWLDEVKGIGPTLAAKILGYSYNCEGLIAPTATVSQFWSFMGYAVKDGKRSIPKKGELRAYNVRGKTAGSLAGESFLKSNSPYRRIYDDWRENYRRKQKGRLVHLGVDAELVEALEPGTAEWKSKLAEIEQEHGKGSVWNDAHINDAARRKMVKKFLSHLWEVYREAVGLPVRPPYVLDSTVPGYDGHGTYLSPFEFVGNGDVAASRADFLHKTRRFRS